MLGASQAGGLTCARRTRALVLATIASGLALGFGPGTARAEVLWRSGARSAPAPMQPAELGQAILDLAARPGERRVVVHFDGPVQPVRRAELESGGVRLLSYLGGYAYFATLGQAVDAARVAVVPGLVAVESIDPANKLDRDLAQGIAHPWSIVPQPAGGPDEGGGESPFVAVYVLFHRDFDLASGAESVIGRHSGIVQSRLETVNGVVAHLPLGRSAALAAEDAVMWVEPPLPALEELNDGARSRTGVDTVNAPPYGLDGNGVTVLVYDGGTIFAHNDLAGRLTIGQSDTGGISDHATHVACTIGGDAAGQLSGMAPAVDIISYTFEQEGGLSQGFLYTNPGDLEDDYSEAISLYGADLSNNSIGTNTAANGFPCSWEGNYGVTGALIDEVVRGALGSPFRVVWANGNERGAGTCGTAYQTTAPPACAKNHLTVGALNSNDDSVTSFTSWGPCDDGRLKPDVSAPGCQSNGDGGLSSCSSSGGYTVKCGTSMASPVTAGISSLLLEQYRASFPARPDFRNSLLRAVLAQTAVDLGNVGPDYQTGYGSIRVQPAVDLIAQERFLEDEVGQGEVFTFTMVVGTAAEAKVTLAWDDPAGAPEVNPVLVNDLDLRIIAPGGGVHWPWTLNQGNPAAPAVRTVRDGVNNIEQVVVSNPVPGTYVIEVKGFNIAEGDVQPFSVATSHAPVLCDDAPTFGGLVSAAPGASCGEINLSWGVAASNCDPAGELSYNVYRGTTPFFVPTNGNRVYQGLAVTSVTDFGLVPGQKYHYLVRAEDSRSGEDTNGVKRSAITPVSPDTAGPVFSGLATASAGAVCGEVVLGWPAAIETCSLPTQYEIHRSTVPGFVPGPSTLVATTFATGFVDTSVPPGTSHTYLVRATDSSGNTEANNTRLAATPTVFDVELLRTGFEPNAGGWSVVAPNDAEFGNWEWGNPSGTSYQPEDDASAIGVNCWITGLAPTPSNGDVDNGSTTLLSAAYDMTGTVNPTIEYLRWFTNDRGGSAGDPTDSFRIDVSNDDGQSWSPLEQIGAGTPLAWVPVSLALPVPATSQVRVRFSTADLGAGSIVEAGIDEFGLIDAGQGCNQCTQEPQTLCTITVERSGNDVRVDWSTNPVGTRAVIYHVTGCDPSDRVKLGTTLDDFFIHKDALLTSAPFQYRVTFVDECGVEQAFCGTTDCP